MAVSEAFAEHVLELLSGLGSLRVKRMFGGAGVYRDDLMFALLDDDVLYIKADAEGRPAFEAAGSSQFTVEMKGRTETMGYWRLPAEAADDPETAQRWARLGLDAALRARKPKKKRAAAPADDLGPGPWKQD